MIPAITLPDAQSIVVLGVFCKLQNPADDSLEYEGPHAHLASYWRHGRLIIAGIADSMVDYLEGKGFEAKSADAKPGGVPLKAAVARANMFGLVGLLS